MSKVPKILDVNPQNVQWLLSLPPKARQFHFSLEEQTSLTESTEPFGRSAAGFQLRRKMSPSLSRPPFRAFSSTPSIGPRSELPLRNYKPLPTPLEEIDETSAMGCPAPFVPMYRVKDETPAERAGPSILARRRRPSLRKAMSLVTFPHAHPAATSSSSPAPLLKEKRLPKHDDCSPIEEPLSSPSEYYDAPETRSKLQRGLSSPQGFDEALEFGFPSVTQQPPLNEPRRRPTRSPLSGQNANSDMQRFFRDNTLSFIDTTEVKNNLELDSDDEEDDFDNDSFYLTSPSIASSREHDGDSVSEFESPVTPKDGDMGTLQHEAIRSMAGRSVKTTFPSQSLTPKVLRYFHDDGDVTFARHGGWEKTLRITLTKPELRATDEEIYGSHSRRPFKADQLESDAEWVQCEDLFKLRGSDHGRMRSLWNRVRQTGVRG